MNKKQLIYDLSLLCVKTYLHILEPEHLEDACTNALNCFEKAYKDISNSNHPALRLFDEE